MLVSHNQITPVHTGSNFCVISHWSDLVQNKLKLLIRIPNIGNISKHIHAYT